MFLSKASIIHSITLVGFVGAALLLIVSAEIADFATCSSIGPLSRRGAFLSNPSTKLPLSNDAFPSIHCTTKTSANRIDAIPALNQKTQQMLQSIRSGGIAKRKGQTESDKIDSSSSLSQHKLDRIKNALLVLISTVAFYGLFQTRSTWMGLFNKEKLQASVVQSLEELNSFPYLYSRLIYTISMALWETLGMSTIPVETAAGMVFGWSALYWSAIGKLLGACLAFGLGRGALSSIVEKKLSTNDFLNLVRSSTQDNPFLVVILIKLSCFPETVKNFGSSMLKPIRWWMFVFSTAVHGWTFTALWTYLGVDTAARLKDVEGLLPPNQRLKVLLTLAVINGVVVSPLSMFYWMRTLKQKRNDVQGTKKVS
mmetsp:Transcript_2853/g.7836  ORF Transcript_2853/g.7836 Transcript_2853/m.7836 type:complete len:369 (+) Transcript_2853:107-1213(+)